MPAPPSYIDITSLPFTRVVTQAEFNSGTFGGTVNTVWFRYVSSGDNILGLYVNEGGTFTPQSTLFKDDGTTAINGGNRVPWWQLLDTNTFYIRVRKLGGGASDFDFTCQFEQGQFVSTPIAAGSLLVNDDSKIGTNEPYAGLPYPATVWKTDGTFLGFAREIVAGELGDALPNGISIWHNRYGGVGNYLKLYNSNLELIATTDTTPSIGGYTDTSCYCNDGTQFFVYNSDGHRIFNVSSSGVVSSEIDSIPLDDVSNWVTALGVSRDGTILYYSDSAVGNTDNKIKKLLIGGSVSTFYDLSGTSTYLSQTGVNNGNGEIIVLSDDSLVTWYHSYVDNLDRIIHISSSGILINSYTQAAGVLVNHIHYHPDNPDKVSVWFFLDGSDFTGRFGELDLATGTLSPSFDIALFSEGSSKVTADSVIFGPSASCSMVTLGYGEGNGEPPAEKGTIIVVKVCPQSPAQDFTFDAVNLSPTTFILSNGEQQIYTDVPAGSGYSVIEQAVSGYTTTYSVSNGSSNTNITVANGETVTVTVTNTVVLLSAGGIYQIVPGKREDTLWVNFPNDTVDVKIPDPFARTGYLGE